MTDNPYSYSFKIEKHILYYIIITTINIILKIFSFFPTTTRIFKTFKSNFHRRLLILFYGHFFSDINTSIRMFNCSIIICCKVLLFSFLWICNTFHFCPKNFHTHFYHSKYHSNNSNLFSNSHAR